jgi:hypothetical protein
MIIFGTRGVTSTSTHGRFYCPQCNAERGYESKKLRRFFTLYFIPLIPMDVVQEWIECGGCRGAFKPEVLRFDPSSRQRAVRAAVTTATRRVLALAAGARPAPGVRAAALAAHKVLLDEDWPEVDLDQDLARAFSPHATLEPVSRVAGDVNANGKEVILAQALTVARAGGALAPETAQALGEAAKALGVTEAHWRGILVGAGPSA